MENEQGVARRSCLEPVPEGRSWRAVPNRSLVAMQLTITAFLALSGVFLLFLGIRLSLQPEQPARGMLFALDVGMIFVVVVALESMVGRLLPWREAVFVVEGGERKVRLLRGRRRRVIPLRDVSQISVVHEGRSGQDPLDSYLEIRAGRRSLVGRRRHEPTAADELRRILPANIEVRERFRTS